MNNKWKLIEEYYEDVINEYYGNNAKKIYEKVDKIFRKNRWVAKNNDMEEFYSVANDVFTDIIYNFRYDKSNKNFDAFLDGALTLAIIDEFKRQTRSKRATKVKVIVDGKEEVIVIPDRYLAEKLNDEDGLSLEDVTASNISVEKFLFGNKKIGYSKDMINYLNSLSKLQKRVLRLIVIGYSTKEILEELDITYAKFSDCMAAIHSIEKTKPLMKHINY